MKSGLKLHEDGPRCSRRRDTFCRGFTLIETLLVLLIISVSLALVSVSIGSGPGVSKKAAARMIAANLANARTQAMSGRTPVYAEIIDGVILIASERNRRETPLPSGVHAQSLKGPIAFYPRGGSSGGGIEVTDNAGHRLYAVTVEPSTGKVSVEAL